MKPLPCPICQSDNIVVYGCDEESKSGFCTVECQDCGAIGYDYGTDDWNAIARPAQNIESLKAELS